MERISNANIPVEERRNGILAITDDTGLFFNDMLKAIKASRVLEIGTSVGYSTLWFADAIKHNKNVDINLEKQIITLEKNPLKIEQANRNFEKAGVREIVEIKKGDAKKNLNKMLQNHQKGKHTISGLFDFVFIDADKEDSVKYFDLVLPMVRAGGIIAADNMLFPIEFRETMTKYANYVRKKPNVRSFTVPIGNGEEITIKLR